MFGSSVSLMIYIFMIAYTLFRISVMVTRGATTVTLTTLEEFYPADHKVSLDDSNLMMAFAVTDYENPYLSVLDPTVLSLYVSLKVIVDGVNT